MNTLTTFEKATISIATGHPVGHEHHTIDKAWTELTDSDKQTIASDWIKDHVLTNVNQVCELLMQNEDHCDYEALMEIFERQDYEEASIDHINDLTINELIEVFNESDLTLSPYQIFIDNYLSDLIENTINTNFSVGDAFHVLEYTFLESLPLTEEEYTQETITKALTDFFINNSNNLCFEDLGACIIDLGINFDGYLKAYQSDLASLIIDNLDLDQYGQDNSLDPEYDQAYEFWAVTDHFKIMLQNELSISDDILGLTVWARYCTGQSICLDHAIQVAAFKALSNCSYEYY